MSAHLLLFSEKFPETFENWQTILDELSVPLVIWEKGKVDYSVSLIKIKTSVRGKEHIESIECYPRNFEDLSEILKSLVREKLGSRRQLLDFKYSSYGAAESFGLGLALMKEHDALCYVDCMNYGFIDFEEAKDGFYKQLAMMSY